MLAKPSLQLGRAFGTPLCRPCWSGPLEDSATMMALGLSLLDESIHVGGRPGDGVREWAGAPGWAPQEENWLQEGEGDGRGPRAHWSRPARPLLWDGCRHRCPLGMSMPGSGLGSPSWTSSVLALPQPQFPCQHCTAPDGDLNRLRSQRHLACLLPTPTARRASPRLG